MLNIIIPMAGGGRRFIESGYVVPKPLIEIQGRPMIEWVVGNVRPCGEHRFTFLCRREHLEAFDLRDYLHKIAPHSNIVPVGSLTQGAACTVLLASDYFNDDNELMIVNSDQYVDAEIDPFIEDARHRSLDGSILTFFSDDTKWSFAKTGGNGFVIEIAEKVPISSHATVGIYYYVAGKDFLRGACSMIEKDIRVKGEFYVCPVYNEMITQGHRVGIFEIEASKMHGLGTPQDLVVFKEYLANNRNR